MSAETLHIEFLPVDRLQAYAANSRTHSAQQVDQIAASITEFGFTNPVLIDEDDGIIAGHGRVAAARKLRLAQVPCIRLEGLSETQKRAYVIADNRLALNAGWDMDILASEIAALNGDGFDLALLGFADDELAGLLAEENVGGGQVMVTRMKLRNRLSIPFHGLAMSGCLAGTACFVATRPASMTLCASRTDNWSICG